MPLQSSTEMFRGFALTQIIIHQRGHRKLEEKREKTSKLEEQAGQAGKKQQHDIKERFAFSRNMPENMERGAVRDGARERSRIPLSIKLSFTFFRGRRGGRE